MFRKERQRAGELELKIAEFADRERDFEKMKNDLMKRLQAANKHAQQLQQQNNQLQVGLQNAKFQSMDTNDTMDQMIKALQDTVHQLQQSQYAAEKRVRSYALSMHAWYHIQNQITNSHVHSHSFPVSLSG